MVGCGASGAPKKRVKSLPDLYNLLKSCRGVLLGIRDMPVCYANRHGAVWTVAPCIRTYHPAYTYIIDSSRKYLSLFLKKIKVFFRKPSKVAEKLVFSRCSGFGVKQ